MLHTSDRWKQIESLFHEGLALPAESRLRFLKERCGDDAEMLKELE